MNKVLIVDDVFRGKVARLLEYARAPEHLYRPGPGVPHPAKDPGHVIEHDDFRIVYSLTRCACGATSRAMSIGYLTPTDASPKEIGENLEVHPYLPGPSIVEIVGQALGFLGKVSTWNLLLNKADRCVVAVQHLAS